MTRKIQNIMTLIVFLVPFTAATGAFGQSSPVIIKTSQPWVPPLAAHEARVVTCSDPVPLNSAAVDDWICPQTGPIIRLVWWGTLSDPRQAEHEFYIAIYSNNPDGGTCEPRALLYEACVKPLIRLRGKDCQENRVWRLTARLPVPFQQVQGEHYWLQISEDDEKSLQPGVEDFRWSAHRPIVKCPAGSFLSDSSFQARLISACDDLDDDLAFELWSRTVTGTIAFPGLVIPPVLRFELLDPTTGDLMAAELFETMPQPGSGARSMFVADSFSVAFSVPDGSYNYRVIGMGMEPMKGSLSLAQGEETILPDMFPRMGDLNGDCDRNVPDLLMMLNGWGFCTP